MGLGHFCRYRNFSHALTFLAFVSPLLAGCEKANGPSTAGAELIPKREREIPPDVPDTDDSQLEPTTLDRQSERKGESSPAIEKTLEAPKFDESASVAFKEAFESLDTWARKRGGTIYAALVDLETNKWLLRSNAQVPVNPASNAKLVTAAAALELLGPDHTFTTELRGTIDDDGHAKVLVLRGGGAPDLTTPDLFRLMRVAVGQGLTAVDKIVVDQSRFSEQFVPPAFEQQPAEWAPFRAPISALALNGNSIDLNVVSTRKGENARVWYDPPGIVGEEGHVETREKGSGDHVSWTLDVAKDPARPVSRVGGRLSEELGRQRYSRRLDDPRLAPGLAFASLLKDAGVKLNDGVELGKGGQAPRIAVWTSEPVAELVRAMGKDSDNFTAEMLFVALSGYRSNEDKKPDTADEAWSSERGAEVVRKWLTLKGIEMEGIIVKNGSGLFDANRLSAELLTKLLAALEDNPRVAQEFLSHLATGATDGTLKKRLQGSDLAARVRAKTGTLRDVDALSGYIQRPGGRSPAAFSVIVVGPKASHSEVRNKVDRTILKWVELLD